MSVRSRGIRHAVVSAAAAGVLCLGVAIPAAPAFAATGPAAVPAVSPGAPSYLALGDSVTFGYREPTTVPPPNFTDPNSFVGYPGDVGPALDLHVANSACPGETSASFIVENVQSNGCENSPGGGPGYRTVFPLHVDYTGTQLQYAVRFLQAHPTTKVVSLMIGANDVFLCQESTSDKCVSELPSVLRQVTNNIKDILTVLRNEAGYSGQIVVLRYYSLNYANATDDAGTVALNHAIDVAAQPFDVQLADVYTAFENAAAHSGGNTCKAGLLTQLSTGGCGVHPSSAGQAVLALAVEKAIEKGAAPAAAAAA